MKRALLSLSAAFGLMLGFCSQPREIRAADNQPRLEQQIRNDFAAGFRGDHSGDKDKSRAFLDRIVKELPGTEHARRAEAWLKDPSYPVEKRTCLDCQLAGQ